MAQRLIITFRASMGNQQEESRSQYDTTIKDLFEEPPQRLLQILIGLNAVKLLSVEFASTQKRLPDLLFLLEDDSILHLELLKSFRRDGLAHVDVLLVNTAAVSEQGFGSESAVCWTERVAS